METLELVINEMKNIIPNFEIRNEQFEMMKSVYEAMKSGSNAAIHAPTGTGKSLGYLIPFVAMKIDEPSFKMTISTFTISLQEQLVKEIKLANQLYQNILLKLKQPIHKIRFTVLKGKTNYFCYQRFSESKHLIPKSLTEKVEENVEELISSRLPLDRQHFNVVMRQNQWEEMQVENCKKEECPFYKQCTFYKSYFVDRSDIAIVNHYLFFNRHFFVDGAWDEYHFNVFDEAHKLEKVMLDTSTFNLSVDKVEMWFYQGVNLAQKYRIDDDKINNWADDYLNNHQIINAFRNGMKILSQKVGKPAVSFEELKFSKKNIVNMTKGIMVWQKEMYDYFKNHVIELNDDTNPKLAEDFQYWGMNLLEINEFYHLLESDDSLLWIAKDNQKLSFKVTPKNLNNIKLPFVRGTLLTSGTLAEKGKTCLPFAERLNLTLQTDKVLPTPFSLKDRTLVYASRTVSPKSSDYENQLEQEIFELITKGEMKTFVLFTSNDTMGKMHANLKYFIEQHAMSLGEKVEVWLQDKSNYEEVMNSFKNPDVRTVLFGTYTYFEGIDLKNESLTQVILTRLPFSVPDHPIQQLLDRNSNFSEWEANIRFEQAFGRLIRTTNDYGTFAILDSRIYFNHNKSFLELFKNENVTVTDDINDIEAFYKNIKK